MMRLVFSDLRDHAATWIGAGIVAVGCGYIGGWVVSLQTTAGFYTDGVHWSLQNAASMMLAFSLVAGMAVLVSAASLTVSVQQRSYALWQLANVRPRLVSVVVLVQLAVVAILGAICGTLFAIATFEPLFPCVFSAKDIFDQVNPHLGVERMPAVWLVVATVFLCGGLKGARDAGRTPPLTALREPEPKHKGMTWLRALVFVCLVVFTYWIYTVIVSSTPYDATSLAVLIIILVVATLASIAPLVFSTILSAWTLLIPQKHWNAWYLARHSARYSLSTSTSIETPIMVGFGLVSGLFTFLNLFAALARSQGVSDTSGYSLDLTTALIMLGGPILLCAIGAAVSVAMSSKSRTHDIALLMASGAKPSTLIGAAFCEALIHTVTATLVSMGGVIVATAIVAHAFGLPLFSGLTFGVGFIVSLVGFTLVLTATLIPTWAALNQETAKMLTVRE